MEAVRCCLLVRAAMAAARPSRKLTRRSTPDTLVR